MSNLVLKTSSFDAIKASTFCHYTHEKKQAMLADILFTDKVRSSDLLSTKGKNAALSTSTPEFLEQVKLAIVAGFPKVMQAALALSGKQPEEKAMQKRYATQQIGARMGDIRTQLIYRENRDLPAVEKADKADKGQTKVMRSVKERILDHLIDARKLMQEWEEPTMEVEAFNQAIAKLLTALK
tara:strand:- start:70 stop:618 length:549 start_codon:yes stop_codon:yes gene_type:complete